MSNNFSKEEAAIDYINKAAELLDDYGFDKDAAFVVELLEKIAGKHERIKMDWLKLEDGLRTILREAKTYTGDEKNIFPLAQIIQDIDSLVGGETGRGYELPAGWAEKFRNV